MIVWTLSLYSSNLVAAEEATTGVLTGKFLLNTGSPLARGSVIIFNASNKPDPKLGKYWKIPDQTIQMDAKGKFSVSLPEGAYFIAAIRRDSGEKQGPPQVGDYFYASHDSAGNYKKYTVKRGQTTSIGCIKGVFPAKQRDIDYGADLTGIERVIRDEEEKPVENALVVAYENPAMLGPPLFASLRTGKDGRYLLVVHKEGNYYLKVRDVYGGGKPRAGGLIGFYGSEAEPLPAVVEAKKVTRGIDIRVKHFMLVDPKQ